MTDAAKEIHEFDGLNPEELHLVGLGANGISPLLAKAAEEVGAVIGDAGDLTKARWAGFCGEEQCVCCKELFGITFDRLIEKSKLKAKARNQLPTSAFALPDKRAYPIHDESHARAALSMLHNASPDEQSKIKAAVHSRYPAIGKGDDVKDTKKQGQPQSSHEHTPVPGPEGSQGQTKENHPQMGAVHTDNGAEGSGAHTPSFEGHPAPSADQEGHGSTAPGKEIPIGEALSQTNEVTRKEGSGDGTGSKMPNGGSLDDAAENEARSQTDKVHRKGTPGDAQWEAHDAALAEQAGELIDQLESRERAEESGGATKSPSLSAQSAETISRLVKTGQAILDANASKEEIEMGPDELIKMLDEREATKKADRKAKKKAQAKKAKAKLDKKKLKQMDDDAEKAARIAADPEYAAKVQAKKEAKAVKKAAKAGNPLEAVTTTIGTLAKGLEDVQKTVEAIASQPQPTPVLNAAGIVAAGGVAALRTGDTGTDSAFKALEDRVAKAADEGSLDEFSKATQQLTTARLIAFERLRAGGASPDAALAAVK